MLGWALRYLLVAIATAALFAMLQGRDWAQIWSTAGVAARQVAGDGSHQRTRSDTTGNGDLEQVIHAGPHGHFLVEAVVNGVPIDFMVDTGASHVVLTQEDASRLGLSRASLRFTQRFQSANGVVRAAPVELREFRIGQFQLYDLEASVNGGPLPISLLGISFLKRLRSYEVARSRLVLRW